MASVLDEINKRFGEGTIILPGEGTTIDVERIPTGSLALDLALGGGIPRGRIIEVYGPEASGKTSLCLHVIAEAQKNTGMCAFIDMEHALDLDYARIIGVDTDALAISQPGDGETALEIVEHLVRSGQFAVVVIDSVAALVPKAEIEGDMGDAPMGMQARLMSQAMRKLVGAIKKTDTVVIFTNQLRQKIGVMYGSPETTTGGNALKFYASQRLDIRRIQAIKKGEEITGARTRVRVVKNKVAPPHKVAEFDIMYNEGISKTAEIIDLGVKLDILTKRGSFFYYGDTKLGQGKDAARSYLRENPELMGEVSERIRAAIAGNDIELTEGSGGEDETEI